jgi:hypothetical protein
MSMDNDKAKKGEMGRARRTHDEEEENAYVILWEGQKEGKTTRRT